MIMKQQSKNRVILIPAWYDNLVELNKLINADIPEFEMYNFGSNLSVQLESKSFKDDSALKEFIVKEFISINFPKSEIDVGIVSLSSYENFKSSGKTDNYFIAFCEVESPKLITSPIFLK